VIGNGESRRDIDLSHFSQTHETIGCNALHRDFIPDHLICVDKRMVVEALTNSVPRIYTRERHYKDYRKIAKNKNVFLLPEIPFEPTEKADQPMHWNSGPYAILLSCQLNHKQIDLIGFDLYGIDFKINNMYKGTVNYQPADSKLIDPNYWIYQISKIFQYFSDVKFTIYNHENWKMPPVWIHKNVHFKKIEDFTA
jgi:hypothetical protein